MDQSVSAQPGSAPGVQVLLVHDSRIALWGLEHLLALHRPAIEVVASTTDLTHALPLIERLHPHVALFGLDLGSEVLDLIAQSRHAPTQVLVIGGARHVRDSDRAVMLGARGVLRREESVDLIPKAILKVHAGELWLDRASTGRLFGMSQCASSLPCDPRLATLTAREHKVMLAAASDPGARNGNLAATLHMSEHTLRNHLSSIYAKLGIRSRLELYLYAERTDRRLPLDAGDRLPSA